MVKVCSGAKDAAWRLRRAFMVVASLAAVVYLSACARKHGIEFESVLHDLGRIESPLDYFRSFVFRNTGTEPVTILQIRPSCPCTRIVSWDRITAPGAEGSITVTFITEGYGGPFNKVIDVTTDMPEKSVIRLTLKGTIVVPVRIVPESAWLGNVERDAEGLWGYFEIWNQTDTPLHIMGIQEPDESVSHSLTVMEAGRKYRIDYFMPGPFGEPGKHTESFTVVTDSKSHERLSPRFSYFVAGENKKGDTHEYKD